VADRERVLEVGADPQQAVLVGTRKLKTLADLAPNCSSLSSRRA